jgi:hypothetical protein
MKPPPASPDLCGRGLQLPTEFYGKFFAEEEAKKAKPITSYSVVLLKYLKKTKKLAPRYTFIDADGLNQHIDVFLLHEYIQLGYLQSPHYVLLLP